MRILFLSDTEAIGGAGIVAARLAKALSDLGHEIAIATNERRRGAVAGSWLRYRLSATRPVRWDEIPDSRGEKNRIRRLRKVLSDFRPDAVSVHNLHGGLKAGWSADMAAVCAAYVPTIWTLHDMWSFTGRCAYSGKCRYYQNVCNAACPTPDEYPFCPSRAIEGEFERKREVVKNHRLLAVSPSHWLAKKAVEGLWKQKPPKQICNPIDLRAFHPVDKARARRALGITDAGPIILSVAADFSDPRKGASLLKHALEGLQTVPATVITMGHNAPNLSRDGLQHVKLGFIEKEELRGLIYSAADIYVHAAGQDNLPNTIAEALSCGTPVVGFAQGGIPEMVVHGVSGALCTDFSPLGLTQVLDEFLGEDLRRASRIARQTAEEFFEPTRQATQYVDLFVHG